MTKFVRLAALAAAATIAATPAAAQVSANPKASASVTINKPLILEAEEDLNLGTIFVYGPGTVRIDRFGATTCGPVDEMICDFTSAQTAVFRVKGQNNRTVTINTSGSTLTNLAGDTLAFTPLAQGTILLPNSSGVLGTTFNVGGEVTLAAATPAGTYTGDIEVTVEY